MFLKMYEKSIHLWSCREYGNHLELGKSQTDFINKIQMVSTSPVATFTNIV